MLTNLSTLLFLIPIATAVVHNTVNTWSGVLQYDEDWGYVDIRDKAHSFWWLYSVKPANNRPLFVWLQGGPGASGTGFGNFEELGPKTPNGSDNAATWLQTADLVFVDNPVGTGFSYVDDKSALTTNVDQIGKDLLAWLRKFLALHPEYRSRPFYIFCESYGGKMSTEFARVITEAVKEGSLQLNFKAVALGDSWISPIDYVNTWGPYLYANSFLDEHQLALVQKEASHCQTLVNEKKWTQATNCWGNMETVIGLEAGDVSWYNILKKGGQDDWSMTNRASRFDVMKNLYNKIVKPQNDIDMTTYMNTIARQKLGIIPNNVTFGAQASEVFSAQGGDFMVPIYETVDELLEDGVNVIVYSGNQDLICNTLGTNAWVQRLKWTQMPAFNTTTKHSFKTASWPLAGFYKIHKNFQYWYHIRAGHMVAYDTPESALYMINYITNNL